MTLRENLARNLRKLCAERSSVARVCRELDINRQQFDKYLNGETLPGARTLAKISALFQISEAQLVGDLDGATPTGKLARSPPPGHDMLKSLEPLLGEPLASLKPGSYYTWITIPGSPGQLVCAPLFVKRRADALTFRRVVGVAEPKSSYWSHFQGDHQGLIVERLNWLFFAAVNHRGTREPTLMRLRWAAMSDPVLSGHGMVLTPSGVSFVAICMRPVPSQIGHRRALRHSRVYDIDAPEIDGITRRIIEQERRSLITTVVNDFTAPTGGAP
jgi:transcriptional regulator with XRE-family HTH domain